MRIILTISFLFSVAFGQSGVAGLNVSMTPAASNPTGLTWTKALERWYGPTDSTYFHLIDSAHINYTSNFSVGVSNLSALYGTAPTTSGGNLQVTGTTSLISTTNPVAPFATVEMTATMGTAATVNQLGVQLISSADSTNYVKAFYDKATSEFKIVINGTTKVTKTATVNTTGLTMWLILQGNNISFWCREDGRIIKLVATINNVDNATFDYETAGLIDNYKYGIWCNSTATHAVSSLRGGASGGAGIFNDRIVKNANGSDYLYNGKWLLTGDWTAFGTRTVNYVYASMSIFSIDTSDYSIECVGRIFIKRDDGAGAKVIGGQDMKLLALTDTTFFFTYVPLLESTGAIIESDRYDTLAYDQLFTQTIISEDTLHSFATFEQTTYDVNMRKYTANMTLYGADGFGSPRPVKYTGSSPTTLANAVHYNDGTAFESVTVFFLDRRPYPLYATFGNARVRCFDNNLNSIGWMQLDGSASGSRIGGYDQALVQSGGNTYYRLVGFNVTEIAPTDITGATIAMPWTMGQIVIYEANQYSIGYEFR